MPGCLAGSWDCRQGEEKSSATAGLGFHPDSPPVAGHDRLANGQPQAGAGKAVLRVQPLEQLEDPLEVLRVDPDALIRHREHPVTGPAHGTLATTCTPVDTLNRTLREGK